VHPLTRDPRARKHGKDIEEYFKRKSKVLKSKKNLANRLTPPVEIVRTANPILEPIPKGDKYGTKLWGLLVRAFHPLSFMGGVGRYIRFYIRNSTDHQILGCLSLGSAVLTCAARDKWIGWNAQKRLKNLRKIANNRRFLILPNVKVPNLASRALSLLCKVGRKEWESRYEDPLVLIETFVELERPGTCYRAAGWLPLGKTKGFTHVVSEIGPLADKRVSAYLYTGERKLIFVKPLTKSWRNELLS